MSEIPSKQDDRIVLLRQSHNIFCLVFLVHNEGSEPNGLSGGHSLLAWPVSGSNDGIAFFK